MGFFTFSSSSEEDLGPQQFFRSWFDCHRRQERHVTGAYT